jgi:hypothetical protein
MAQREMNCKLHGPTPVTLACRHLKTGVACGFHTIGTGERPDAWCDKCNDGRALGGEWTQEMNRQAHLGLTCTYCYDLASARNREIPPFAKGARTVLSSEEFRKLCDHARTHVDAIQDTARRTWSFDAYERWDFDEDARTLSFIDPARSTLVTDVRIVGAFSPALERFQWSWDKYGPDDLLIAGMPSIRTYGEVRGITQLTTSDWDCSLAGGWNVTVISAYLLGCAGVYRADFDDKYWFMLLANWRHSRRGVTHPGTGID